jgi:hypothetical protein
LRDAASDLLLWEEGSLIRPVFLLGALSKARLLLLFHSGVGFGGVTVAPPLRLEATHHFTGLNGQPATEKAALTLTVPARPPFFDEEAP